MASPPGPQDPFDYNEYRPHRPEFPTGANDETTPAGRHAAEEPTSRFSASPANTPLSEDISLAVGKPPLAWLAAAAASVALGVVAAVLAGRSAAAVAAWVLTGPIALGLLAVYTRADLEQQARYSYLRSPYATVVYAVVLAAAAAGVLFSGWNLADWLARR